MRPDISREAERNRVLRRADWRFLLPDPNPATSLCLAGGLLGRAVESISERVAEANFDPLPGSCDLAVAVDPDQSMLERARKALREGGAFYTEWYALPRRGPKGIRRRLEKIGFTDVMCYWPRPNPSRGAAVWLPLESPAALRYFFTARMPPRNTVRRMGRVVRRAGRLARPRLRLAAPICATATKPARSGPKTHPPGPLEMARAKLEGSEGGLSLSWLLITGGRRSLNKAVALAFDKFARTPRLAVKMTRTPESTRALGREASTLATLHARPERMEGIPRVLFCERYGDILAVGETAVTGVPLSGAVGEENFADLATKATEWLIKLAGRAQLSPPQIWRGRLIESVITRFQADFGPVVDAGLLREATDLLAGLGSLPIVCEQRDFSPWNVLLTSEGQLAVLDWESSEPEGLAGCDLIYFLTHLAFRLDRAGRTGQFRDAYRRMLDPASRTGSVAAKCFSDYAARVGLSEAVLHPLRVLVWMVHSRSNYEHLAADVGHRPVPEALRRAIFLGLWEEELRHCP